MITVQGGMPNHHPRHWAFPDEGALDEALEYWMAELGLGAWSIDVHRVAAAELQGLYAQVHWTISRRRATIKLLSTGQLRESDDPMDEEQTLVHELLHVAFSALQDSSKLEGMADDVFSEQPIDKLAFTLVNLRRLCPCQKFLFEDEDDGPASAD